MSFLGVPFQLRQVVYLLGDVLVALVALYLGHVLRLELAGQSVEFLEILNRTTGASFFFVSVHLVVLYVVGAYTPTGDYRRTTEVLRLIMAVAVAFVIQMALFYAFPHYRWSRGVAGLSALSFGVLLVLWRRFIVSVRPPGTVRYPMVIVGAGDAGEELARVVRDTHGQREVYDPVGFVDDTVGRDEMCLPVLGTVDELPGLVERYGIRLVVVALDEPLTEAKTKMLLDLKAKGIRIVDMPTHYKQLTGRVPVAHLRDSWILFGPGFAERNVVAQASSRLMDIAVSAVGLVLSSPLILLAAIAIKLTSPRGPILFRQERLGRNEVPFSILKLRTMTPNAEARTGPVRSEGAADPRITRVGWLLRRTRIDELPQFLNVLKGDMSLIGPRPVREIFATDQKEKIPYYGLRFAVKPGLTGWAQVCYRYGNTVEDARQKVQYDLYAIQEMSPVLYSLILLKTVQTLLLRWGM